MTTIHFPPVNGAHSEPEDLQGAQGAIRLAYAVPETPSAVVKQPLPTAASRPDIALLRSMMGSSEQIRSELKTIGNEETYVQSLRVLKTQGLLIARLADELLVRFEAAGE